MSNTEAKSKKMEGGDTSSHVFGNALQTWIEIDLPSLQKKLDEQGIELKEDQKASLLSRKNLASKTKEFKKLEDSEKLNQFKSLLKLYQNEIDNLTTKNKMVESYFFGIYRSLAEAPDPRPLLEMSLDSVIESKETLSLRKEVDRLTDELAKRADYDNLKQRLLQNEQKAAELLSLKLNAKEDEFKSIIDEKESNWLEKENHLKDQIKIAQRQIEELRTSNEVTELKLDNQNKQTGRDGVSASTLAELEIVTRDAEASKKRVFELEKRNEDLRRELSKSQNDIEIKSIKEDYSKRVSELEGENVLLVANLNQTRKKLQDSDKEHALKTDSLNRDISSMELEIKNLKLQLDKASDYEEIKGELQLLRQIEFGHGDEDDETGNANAKVDSILIERNKSLTQQLADHRAQHDDLNSKIVSLEAQVESSLAEVNRLKELNEKLENDLANLQDVASSNRFNDNASLISGMSRMTRPNGRSGSIISGHPGNNSFGSGLGIVAEDSPSILPIITKQRDRFREKNNELEEELRKQFNLVNELKRQNNSLKKDNEELYERTRYLASFQTPGTRNITTTSTGRKFLNPKPNTDLESNPYQQSYELKLHPIEQFRMREQERINSRLSPLERLFISITRAVLTTRTTRMLFLAYCLGLHIIVMFVTIYAMNLSTTLIPEVGKNTSTGGIASSKVVNDVSSGKVASPL
ncbi:CASP protein, putative [Candida dubliniensis CD36]|uniref:Protein CASP n=1 Tax=Candida dubliniensis (strain CD36 / ATCC MYA-646 / CBS 7987 / NCPF 3949 / NRRL Y-17841) TaxID=573826 RepID=B9WB56_CANDC|nr:CASP protein, putative [Candida dubliniensis CD36]CAX43626.1 CASP protein, putative [Candida dubliniensis CD36]